MDNYLLAQAQRIQEELDQLIPESDEAYSALFEVARYSLLGPGKRLRPILAVAAAEALGEGSDAILAPACALEMVHCYSLIHDDLPAMDDDDLRRGLATCHRKFGEWKAILAGDYLLTQAFETLYHAPDLSANQRLELIRVLSKAAGGHGMIAGQVLDLEGKGKDLEELAQIHQLKTGAMICAALDFGAIVAGATAEQRAGLAAFGSDIGLAYQVVDDILDITASEKKGRSSDEANGKVTYVTLLGLQTARERAETLFDAAVLNLEGLDMDTERLCELAELLVKRIY